MTRLLTAHEVPELLDALTQTVKRPECWTCDCLQVFLTQLELDATEEEVADLIGPLKAPPEKTRTCKGCYRCPPGSMYADYLRHGHRA
jgi:hypothetical protein